MRLYKCGEKNDMKVFIWVFDLLLVLTIDLEIYYIVFLFDQLIDCL